MKAEKFKVRFNELANMYPRLTGRARESVKEDVRENGVMDAVTLWDDEGRLKTPELIDGANRVEIYNELLDEGWTSPNGPIQSWVFPGDAMQALIYVDGKNEKRRHLSSSQRAAVAAERMDLIKKFRRKLGESESSRPDGDVAELVARQSNTNRSYIFEAVRIREKDEGLHRMVKAGNLSITEAKDVLNRRVKALRPDLYERLKTNAVTMKKVREEMDALEEGLAEVVDGRKQAVDEPLREVFAAREQALAVRKDLLRLKREVAALCDGPAGVHLEKSKRDLGARFNAILGDLDAGVPYAACPVCHGTKKKPGARLKCETCDGQSFLTRAQWKQLPENLKGGLTGDDDQDAEA